MTKSNTPIDHQRALTIALIITLIGGLVFLLPFLSPILFAILMAFLFTPAYRRLLRRVKLAPVAAGLTMLLSFVIIVTPLVIVLALTVGQLSSLAAATADYFSDPSINLPDFINNAITSLNTLLEPLNNGQPPIKDGSVVEYLKSTVPGVIHGLIDIVVGVVGSIPAIGLFLIIYIILFFELLMHGERLVDITRALIPFNKVDTETYLRRIGLMTNAMVKGQFVISAALSLISSFLLIFIGLGDYFFVIFTLSLFLNLIPLGSSVLVIPILVIYMLLGNLIPGLIVLTLFLISGNLEHLIRPHVIPKEAQMSPSLTMLAAFGGLAYFGAVGLIYGPVLMIIVTTTIEMYINSRKKRSAAA